MKSATMVVTAGLAFGALAVPAWCAEEPGLDVAFKLRGAIQAASAKDGLGSKVLGMGLELSAPLGKGRVFCEVGYQFKPGNESRADLADMQRATAHTVINPDFSVNSQKNKVEGAMVRLGCGGALNTSWAWKAGLQLGGAKFYNQAIGHITDGTIDNTGLLNDASYLDTYAAVNTKSFLAVSPFGGLSYRVDASSSIEFGILFLNYKTYIHNHVAGTEVTDPVSPDPSYVWGGHTGQDSFIQKSRLVPHFEVAYVFHF